jgi:hypothetical protein
LLCKHGPSIKEQGFRGMNKCLHRCCRSNSSWTAQLAILPPSVLGGDMWSPFALSESHRSSSKLVGQLRFLLGLKGSPASEIAVSGGGAPRPTLVSPRQDQTLLWRSHELRRVGVKHISSNFLKQKNKSIQQNKWL